MAEREKQHIVEPDMVCLTEDEQTICTIHDTTPGSNQKKISIIVRPSYTVAKVIGDIKIQFSYDNFDLILQPSKKEDSIYLNDKKDIIFYKLPGFVPKIKNILILSPPGTMLSTSELSSVTIQSKIKLSSSTNKQSLKSHSLNCNEKINRSTKNISVTSSAISNGDTVHIEKSNVKNSLSYNSSSKSSNQNSTSTKDTTARNNFIEKNIESVNICETLNKISAAITEQANMPVPVVAGANAICSNKISATSIATLISTVEIQPSKELELKPNDGFKKSPSPKKVLVKKKTTVSSSGSEIKNDGDKSLKSSEESESNFKKSLSPKKVVIKKKIAAPIVDNNTEITSNMSTNQVENDKEVQTKISTKKVIKNIVSKKANTDKVPASNEGTLEAIFAGEDNSFKKSPSPKKVSKKIASTSIAPKDSITSIEINSSKSSKSKEITKENEKTDNKPVTTKFTNIVSKLEIKPKLATISDDKETGHTTITLKSKKVSVKNNENSENKNILTKKNIEADKDGEISKLKLSSASINTKAEKVKSVNDQKTICNNVTKTEDAEKFENNSNNVTIPKEVKEVSKLLETNEIEIHAVSKNSLRSTNAISYDTDKDSHNSKPKIIEKEHNKQHNPAESSQSLVNSDLKNLKKMEVDLNGKYLATNEFKATDGNSFDCSINNFEDDQKVIETDDEVDKHIFLNTNDTLSDDDLALGASASPVENITTTNGIMNLDTAHNKTYDSSKETQFGKYSDLLSDDDLALGASASPTEPEFTETTINVPTPPALPMFKPIESAPSSSGIAKLDKGAHLSSNRPANCGYVGLVNQAMTCYLNSLLQALFMTPEFRNALYNREFDNGKDDIIPYQLQRLFLNLQTSTKNAVETTDLTKSFGWDSTEAWQQHDIQELCRVMFDALEHKFKNTHQANLINILYEGKMIDYVKCLECKTEKSREDTFLDIPLPVRPFGSVVAYGSIEEALRAFVQPETLDGNNQYFCEKCDKKCDAHKGLKFKKFPYILTLHLKRFDFDYQTLHRIKLNDKVTFPQILNLNSFVKALDTGTHGNFQNNNLNHSNGYGITDDCSTTDSGAALEEDNCSGIATTASSSHNENELQEDDEGIDTSNCIDNRLNFKTENGPFMYELFAIMIHSGSASGGHYYAYIKEFENSEWYCFNDQTVTSITQEDIQKSFGGGSFKAYYSSMYSSSTNAYMLMYRQIDLKRNEKCIKSDEFPEHIKRLLERMKTDEETRRTTRNYESDIIRQKVYFFNPKLKEMKDAKIYVPRDFYLDSALDSAYSALKVSSIAPLERCRLVAYDHNLEEIECSFEGCEKEEFGDLLKSLPADIGFLLEICEPNEEFEKYKSGGVTIKVFVVDLSSNDLDGPYSIRVYENEKLGGLKKRIGKKLKVESELFVSIKNYYTGEKVYVTKNNKNIMKSEADFKKFVETQFSSINCFFITVPVVENENLEVLGIPYTIEEMKIAITPRQSPSFDRKQGNDCGTDIVDAVMMNGMSTSYNDMNNFITHSSGMECNYSGSSATIVSGRSSPPQISISQGSSTGSNSEDSSLSDGDRTLVESNPHGSSQVSSTSHSPQLSSPEDENLKIDGFKYTEKLSARKIKERQAINQDVFSDDEEITNFENNLYFRVYNSASNLDLNRNNLKSSTGNILEIGEEQVEAKSPTTLKVFVDKYMKIGSLKRGLESYVNVSAEYFKLVRKQCDQLKSECPKNQEDLTMFKDGEQLSIELGREAKKGERKAKIYFMRRKDLNDETGKMASVCEFIFKLGLLVIDAKKQLVAQLHRIDSKQYETLTLENCRLWEKNGRNPIKILSDDYKLGDLKMSINYEFIIQECDPGVKATTNENSLTLFVRRWHPSKYVLGEFEELTLEKDSEIRKMLSSISQIPEENISFAKVNSSSFPCNNISLLTLNTSLSWFSDSMTTDNYPLLSSICGCVYIYKDNTEALKELTAEERKELSTKDKARLDRLGGTIRSLYSPRRERALKIYLDSPPKSSRDD